MFVLSNNLQYLFFNWAPIKTLAPKPALGSLWSTSFHYNEKVKRIDRPKNVRLNHFRMWNCLSLCLRINWSYRKKLNGLLRQNTHIGMRCCLLVQTPLGRIRFKVSKPIAIWKLDRIHKLNRLFGKLTWFWILKIFSEWTFFSTAFCGDCKNNRVLTRSTGHWRLPVKIRSR